MSEIQNIIKKTLIKEFNPSVLKIVNESYMHSVPKNAETHFKLVIVSNFFMNITQVKRHLIIYKSLEDIMKQIHALSIHSFDENEYSKNPIILDSPNCVKKK
jgi:BolA protein|tara:strand:+ start:318 stop:623 length:306 start_codon:yes stop_codon:yes gene_type:complete